MAGPKGVVNLLQQFLKTGASSGTLDAALGACKVRTERFLQNVRYDCNYLFGRGTIGQITGICCLN